MVATDLWWPHCPQHDTGLSTSHEHDRCSRLCRHRLCRLDRRSGSHRSGNLNRLAVDVGRNVPLTTNPLNSQELIPEPQRDARPTSCRSNSISRLDIESGGTSGRKGIKPRTTGFVKIAHTRNHFSGSLRIATLKYTFWVETDRMCQCGVFDAFRHGMCCFPPAGAAPTENESQLAQKCHIRLKTAKSAKKWRKMHKKVQKRRKTTLWAVPAVETPWRVEMCHWQ